MAMEPSVTILVTVRNSVHTIKKCIDSLLKLKYKNKKIYVTDAFSNDGTWEILKKYGKRIRLERVRGGIAEGHNYMIKRCNTKYVALTDADCVVDKYWLNHLVDAFKDESIVASGSIGKTPKVVNRLQRLTGLELDNRVRGFPKYISRLPTMSLCILTKYAKKVPFDEKLGVAQETDWGYRVTKFGKIAYVPDALVYHYHRSTLWKYFLQQYRYGKYMPIVYLRKHRNKIFGDEISKPSFPLQIVLLYTAFLTLLSGILLFTMVYLSVLFFVFLFVIYLFSAINITRNVSDILYLLILFVTRNVAWCLGIARGVFLL